MELELLNQKAEMDGMRISDWVRMRILGDTNEQTTDDKMEG